MDKFSWDEAIDRVSKRSSVSVDKSSEVLMKSVNNYFDDKNKKIKPFESYYHPSQIYDMCVLQEYYRRLYEVDSVDECDFYLRLVAGAGTAAHKHFQEHIFGPAKVLVGNWFCQKCGNDIGTDCLMPDKCIYCGAKRQHVIYDEIKIENKELKVRGKVDGILDLGDDYLLEMKTKGITAFDNVKKPTRKELFQINLYMHLLDIDKCILVYIKRDNYDFKLILSEKDSSVVNEVLTKIDVVERALEKGSPPRKSNGKPYRRCRKCTSSNAKSCPFREECWELEDE